VIHLVRLQDSFALDHLWRETMGLPPGDSKRQPLRLVAELLEREAVAWALIGGVAVQLHVREPRSTRDIDLAVRAFEEIPREALIGAGFSHTGRFDHSDNWLAPGGTVVQFSVGDEDHLGTIERATVIDVDGMRLRLATPSDLVRLKLAAAVDPRRRSSKRRYDIADIAAILEENPLVSAPELAARIRQVMGDDPK
jgi:predicted nucleotidyltransferase